MDAIKLLSLTGFILVLAGIVLMAAQFAFPEHFIGVYKTFQGFGIKFQTNEVGFGVIIIGVVVLLAGATISKRANLPKP
jgi:hypothetical protein